MKVMNGKFLRLSTLLCFGVSACSHIPSVGPDYEAPPVPEVATWDALESANSVTVGETSLQTWWTIFRDDELNALVDLALKNNYDLTVARARVREARALRSISIGEFFPSIDASGIYSRSRRSESGLTAQTVVPTDPNAGSVVENAVTRSISAERNLYQAGFDASWEIDIFGGLRRNYEAADADLEATGEQYRDALVTLIAEVTSNYVELRSFQKRFDIALRNIDIQRESLEITQARFDAGITSELDVAQARTQLESTRSQLPTIEVGVRSSMYRLSVLIGEPPASLSARFSTTPSGRIIPEVPQTLVAGLPSELLRNRPDVRRAERELAAATARIGVATADLFPRITLVGGYGYESVTSGDLFDPKSRAWNFGPSITWPIFRGGQILSNIEVQNAREEQALATYKQTVLLALEEGENSLISFVKEKERYVSLANALTASQRADELAKELYTRGLADFLRVLESQRSTYLAEDQLVQSERAIALNMISIYKAFGGGWQEKSA